MYLVIADIVMAPTVKRESLPILNMKVKEFLQELEDVFDVSKVSLSNTLCEMSYGPLRTLWCIALKASISTLRM